MQTKQALTTWSLVFVITILLLTAFGVLFVFEASLFESLNTFGNQFHILQLHLVGLTIGLLGLIAMSFISPKFWLKLAPGLYVVGLILLILVFMPWIGLELNGAHRWISLGPINFQPVEAFKFCLIVFFASWLSIHQKLLPFLFLLGIPALIILLQPDLGSLLVVATIAVSMYFLAGGKTRNLLLLFAVAIPLLLIAVVLSPYRFQRLTTFINPNVDVRGASFHIHQITVALGQGGWIGQGLGNSSQKFAYIPETSTDSIFAITAEEVGFLGSLVFIIGYGTVILAAYRIITLSSQPKAVKLAAQGMLVWIGAQTLLNLAAIVGLVPLTGIPLPFFSYGRSSQIMILLAAGYILSLRKNPK